MTRLWFLVFDNLAEFAGACFVAVPQSERSLAGAERAAREAGLYPPGARCLGLPCPYEFTPPPACLGKLLSFEEWRAFWFSCAPPVTS